MGSPTIHLARSADLWRGWHTMILTLEWVNTTRGGMSSWGGFSWSSGPPAIFFIWTGELESRSSNNSKKLTGGWIWQISKFHWLLKEFYQGSANPLAYVLESWARNNQHFFISVKVFGVFEPVKVYWTQQKQNKQTLNFISNQKLSKSVH